MQNRTSGGSRETDVNELTVVPTARPSTPVVITVTPVTNRPHTWRRVRDSTGWISWVERSNEFMSVPSYVDSRWILLLQQLPGPWAGLQGTRDHEASQLAHVRSRGEQAPANESRQHPATGRHEPQLRVLPAEGRIHLGTLLDHLQDDVRGLVTGQLTDLVLLARLRHGFENALELGALRPPQAGVLRLLQRLEVPVVAIDHVTQPGPGKTHDAGRDEAAPDPEHRVPQLEVGERDERAVHEFVVEVEQARLHRLDVLEAFLGEIPVLQRGQDARCERVHDLHRVGKAT